MKLGYCLLMLANEQDPLGTRFIPLIKKAGFAYAEVPLGKLFPLSDAAVEAYIRAFQACALPVEAFNCSLVPSVPLAGPAVDAEAVEHYIARSVSLAVRFGVKVITSCAPVALERAEWERQGKSQYISFLQKMADACARHGIVYALEPICSAERGCINTTAQALEVLAAAGRPNLKLIVDLFHFDREKESAAALPPLCGASLCHLHFADLSQRKVPLAAHQSLYRAQLEPLFAHGFNGRISIEAFADDPERDIPQAYQVLRQACEAAGASICEASFSPKA